MQYLKQSTAITLKIGPFLDDNDGKTAETTLTIAQADVRLSKNGGNIAEKTEATSCTHDELGIYGCPLGATDTGTLGRLQLWVHESGALPVWHEYTVVPANVYDSLFSTDKLEVDLKQIGGVVQSATDLKDFADTGYDPSAHRTQAQTKGMDSGVLTATAIAADAITAAKIAADAISSSEFAQAAADKVWATATRALTDKAGFTISGTKQTLDALNDITAASVWSVGTRALTDKVGFGLSTAGILAIWHQLSANIVTANTIGKLLKDNSHNAAAVWSAGGRALTTPADYKADVSALALEASLTDIKGTGFAKDTHSLPQCLTAAGFSTHNAAAIWTAGSRALSTPANYKADVSLLALEATLTAMKQTAAGSFDRDLHSLEAIRERGDIGWITGGGGGITDIVQVIPSIPTNIDLADTKTIRIALYLINSLDDLPTTAEIVPGTITIERSADGGTSWSMIVNAAACTEQAGQIYYDEVFDSGTGYASGDMIRITFKSQKITVAANDYEITDATYGWMFHTRIDGGGGGGGGGDATAANQTTIITHLTDVKGTGFIKDTHSLKQSFDLIQRILGLTQENHYIDNTTFETGKLKSARIRIYSVAGSVGTASDVIATYNIAITYDANGNMVSYKATKA